MEAVGNLNRPGSAGAGAPGISAGAIARDHGDAGVLAQPCGQRARFAAGQQRYRPPSVEVHQHGAVGVPFAQRPVVHAQGRRCRDVGQRRLPDQAQQRVAAGVQPELAAEAHAGHATKGQAYCREPPGEARRFARPRRCDARKAFGEEAALAPGVVTKQASNAQLERDGILAPGQVCERPPVTAVDALGPPVTERASCRRLARAEVNGHGGLGGLKCPGFEPDLGRVRQQARK